MELRTPHYTHIHEKIRENAIAVVRFFICSLAPVHEDLPLVGLFLFLPGDRLLRRHCAPGSLSLRVPYLPSSADLPLSRTCLWLASTTSSYRRSPLRTCHWLASFTFQHRRPASGWLLKPPPPSPRPLPGASSQLAYPLPTYLTRYPSLTTMAS